VPGKQKTRDTQATLAHKPSPRYVAIIADMVASRTLTPARRSRVQEQFTALIRKLNRIYRKHLSAKFVITLGDEFQGLLRDPEMIPHLVWNLEQLFLARELRLGFGYGPIYTSIKEYAINLDGPALHNARASIDAAKRRSLQGGVFTGFGPALDPALNGFARVLHHERANWPPRQREVVRRLHDGRKGTEIARELGITKQAVSRYASLAGWEAYVEAEQGWSALLRPLATGGKA
jgi:hypothetical protein